MAKSKSKTNDSVELALARFAIRKIYSIYFQFKEVARGIGEQSRRALVQESKKKDEQKAKEILIRLRAKK